MKMIQQSMAVQSRSSAGRSAVPCYHALVLAVLAFSPHVCDAGRDAGSSFGPGGCVSLYRSSAGTCVLRTDCAGRNTESVEFMFDCVSAGVPRQRHSFGKGGFDAHEEYDTAVKCDQCKTVHTEVPVAHNLASTKVATASSKPSASNSSKNSSKNESSASAEPAPDVVKYGPKDCVSVWRNATTTHCMMKTECGSTDISSYNFGLICMGETGPVRHLFGVNSFDPNEEFDTLIPCNQCLGLDSVADDVAVEDDIKALAVEVKDMKKDMEGIVADVKKLNETVLKNAKKTQLNVVSNKLQLKGRTKSHGVSLHHRHLARRDEDAEEDSDEHDDAGSDKDEDDSGSDKKEDSDEGEDSDSDSEAGGQDQGNEGKQDDESRDDGESIEDNDSDTD